jgi:hypothetical protein
MSAIVSLDRYFRDDIEARCGKPGRAPVALAGTTR